MSQSGRQWKVSQSGGQWESVPIRWTIGKCPNQVDNGGLALWVKGQVTGQVMGQVTGQVMGQVIGHVEYHMI